jgi:hypothetical protein
MGELTPDERRAALVVSEAIRLTAIRFVVWVVTLPLVLLVRLIFNIRAVAGFVFSIVALGLWVYFLGWWIMSAIAALMIISAVIGFMWEARKKRLTAEKWGRMYPEDE